MKRLRGLLLLLAACQARGGYQYYIADSLTSIDPAKWSTVGAPSPSSTGLTAPGASGGSLISRVPIPDGTSEAQVRITLGLTASGGTYTAFLGASADARTSGGGAGTYLAVEMQNPTLADNYCLASFRVLQSTAGVVTALGSFPNRCRDGMELRLAVHGAILLVWADEDAPREFSIPGPVPTGQPGIAAYGTPGGNRITQVQLGIVSRVAPTALSQLVASAFPNHIDLKWAAGTAAATSPGIATYWVYRDGLYFGRTADTMFQDETVSPKSAHTYTVYAVDQHYNFSPAATVTAPAPSWPAAFAPKLPLPPTSSGKLPKPAVEARAVLAPNPLTGPTGVFDPRRVGVQPTGAYWGGAGENIDLISGNLNFSLPLLTAQGRGGWTVPFRFSYNSQMWRQDANGTWFFGYDLGYGFGLKLLAGAITPIWANSIIDHYLYTDSTGAEYRLDQNSGSLWTSTQGIYVTFDANTNILHFNDGTSWTFGCQSALGEPDSGTLYPTAMEDTNGNQITVGYEPGGNNLSGRISFIADSRAVSNGNSAKTWSFVYNYSLLAPYPLQSISSWIPAAESYNFRLGRMSLYSPFDGT